MQKKKFNSDFDDPLGLLGGGPSTTVKKATKQNAFEKAMREQEKQLLGDHPRPETEAWVQNPNFKAPTTQNDSPVMKNPFGIPSTNVAKEATTEKPASKGDISLFGNNNNGSPQPARNPFERADKPEAAAGSNANTTFKNPFGAKEETTQAAAEKPVLKNPFAAGPKEEKPHFMQAGEHASNPNVVRNPFQQVTASPTEKSDEEENRGSRPRGAHVKIEDLRLSTDELLPGEKISSSIKCIVTPAQYPHLSAEGILGVTNFKIVFKPNDETYMKRGFFKSTYFQLPHGLISKIERNTDKKNFELVYLDIHSKDGRMFKFRITEKYSSESNPFIQLLYVYAFPDKKTDLFAFEYGKAGKNLEENYGGWKIYDIEREFHRQGIDFADINDRSTNHLYRLVDNSNGQVCSTYPPKLLIPARVSDQALYSCSRFRTKERIPAITYYYKKTKTVLARSSQSKPGITQARCLEDELLLRLLGNPLETSESETTTENLYIYDARPYLNAVANRVNGKGFEDPKWYRNSKIFFMDIDNIHHVRDGHKKLMTMCNSHEVANNKWYSQLHDSNWLAFMSYIIGASCKAARALREKKNVLVHCSDGWDRTSQILSLAQMMLDPYFRTIEGFEVLVMKDWVYFGHQFNLRSGHGNRNDKDDQRSPVFLQFLDAIHQLIHQYPFAFEFNDKFLFDIAHHIYSCQFGTFLCNSYQELKQYKLEEKTICIWSLLNSQKERYLNSYYKPADPENPIILNPSYHMKQLRVWEEFFLYYSWLSKPNYHHLSDNVVFHKDFYEVMYLKEKAKNKEMKNEIEELKAKLQKYEAIEEKPTNDKEDMKDEVEAEEPIFDFNVQEESSAIITSETCEKNENDEESPLKANEDGEGKEEKGEEEEIDQKTKEERELE